MDENKTMNEEVKEDVNVETEVVEAEAVNTENYEEAPYVAPQAVDDGKGLSIAALVLGIAGIIGGWFPIVQYFTLVCSILGIIFGLKGRKKSTAIYGKASGLATAGFVLGIIGVACTVIGIICVCAGVAALAGMGAMSY